LTRIIRDEGVQKVILTDASTPKEEALKRLKEGEPEQNPVAKVSCKKRWMSRVPNHTYDVVAVDCGIKNSLVRQLNAVGCNVTVLPYNSTVEEVMSFRPDGVVIPNGPGNPEEVPTVVELVKQLRGRKPIFGIGLGMQLVAMAYGAKVEKMKVGHRGGNHPVENHKTGLLEVAPQNHGYVVKRDQTGALEITHTNVLDQTIEGLQCTIDRVITVQFDPTAAEGECHDLFKKFVKLMEEGRDA
jgi:carbamoyl-phosphate synthase small subunit